MKRVAFLALFLALAVLSLVGAGRGVALAQGGPIVIVQPLMPKPGDVITVKGENLGPGSTVQIRIVGPSVSIDLGKVQADSQGNFTAQFRVPVTLAEGIYQLQANGAQSAAATLDITTSAVQGSGTQTTQGAVRQRPLGETIGLIVLFIVVAGLGLLFARTVRLKPQTSS